MTTELRDLMTERTDRLAPPALDVASMMGTAERRIRRRRWSAATGVAALGVLAAVVVPGQWGGDGSDRRVAGPTTREAPIAWVNGSVLHTSPGGGQLELGHRPVAIAQGESGHVFVDSKGTVHAVIDDEVLEVGRVGTPKQARLVADGDVVTWVDTSGDQPAYAALDLSAGTGVVRLPFSGSESSMPAEKLGATEAIAAVDGQTVYLHTTSGADAWQPFASADERVPVAVADGDASILVLDVKNGVFHYQRSTWDRHREDRDYLVGPDLTSGVTLESWDGILSPDGRHLMSETADENWLSDTATGDRLPFDPGSYDFAVGYRWLDEDTYAAIAMKTPDATQFDLLRCELTTGACETEVEGQDQTQLLLPFGNTW